MTKPKVASQRKGKASILKEDDVRRIREVAARGGASTNELARFYGVGVETIRRAIRGETWGNLHMSPILSEEELSAQTAASAERMQAAIAAEKKRLSVGSDTIAEMAALTIPEEELTEAQRKARALGARS